MFGRTTRTRGFPCGASFFGRWPLLLVSLPWQQHGCKLAVAIHSHSKWVAFRFHLRSHSRLCSFVISFAPSHHLNAPFHRVCISCGVVPRLPCFDVSPCRVIPSLSFVRPASLPLFILARSPCSVFLRPPTQSLICPISLSGC